MNWIREVNFLLGHDVIDHDVHFKMFKYNANAKYTPKGGQNLQILSGKDYNQIIVINSDATKPARFLNISYPLGEMRVGDKLWTNWNKAPSRLWQTQLNFTVRCALSACRVSSMKLKYKKFPMVKPLYQFHVYYHVR